MKKHSFLAVFFVICGFLSLGCLRSPGYEGYRQKISASVSDKGKLQELHTEISRDLAARPDDHGLLLLRMELSVFLDDSTTFDMDMLTLARMFPRQPYYQFQKCLIMERHTGLNDAVRECYRDILPLYEGKMEFGKYTSRWDYIVTSLMAEAPGAEALKEKFIRSAGDDPVARHDKQLLYNFTRDVLVMKRFPSDLSFETD